MNVMIPVAANPDWSGFRPVNTLAPGVSIGMHILGGLLLLFGIYYAVRSARREGTLNPVYILIGGALSIFYEPMGDLGAHVTYHADQTTAVAAYGFSVPTWMIPTYPFVVGVSVIWLINTLRTGLTAQKWWIYYSIFVVCAICFELPMIFLRAVQYYGTQSITVFGYPVWMAFVNVTGLVFVPGTILYLLIEHGVINKRNGFLLIPLTPLVAAGSHTAADFTRSYVMNGDHGRVAIEAVSLVSIAAAVFLAWLCSRVLLSERASALTTTF